MHVSAQICGHQKLCVQFAHGWKSDNIPKCVIPYNKTIIETIWNEITINCSNSHEKVRFFEESHLLLQGLK